MILKFKVKKTRRQYTHRQFFGGSKIEVVWYDYSYLYLGDVKLSRVNLTKDIAWTADTDFYSCVKMLRKC
jgi:hypothetical protein